MRHLSLILAQRNESCLRQFVQHRAYFVRILGEMKPNEPMDHAYVPTTGHFLGLASLTVDVVRGMYVRTHLQVAADAACQAAADALKEAWTR